MAPVSKLTTKQPGSRTNKTYNASPGYSCRIPRKAGGLRRHTEYAGPYAGPKALSPAHGLAREGDVLGGTGGQGLGYLGLAGGGAWSQREPVHGSQGAAGQQAGEVALLVVLGAAEGPFEVGHLNDDQPAVFQQGVPGGGAP